MSGWSRNLCFSIIESSSNIIEALIIICKHYEPIMIINQGLTIPVLTIVNHSLVVIHQYYLAIIHYGQLIG